MSSLNWKSRMFVAVATASMLTGAGAVALANATTSTPDPTSAPTTASSGTDATALQRSLDDLLSTVGGLEKAVADSATAAGTTSVGTRYATRSGADDSSSVTEDNGSDSSVADDSDDDSDDDGSFGDDSDHDNGGVQGSDEDSHVDD